MENRALVVDLGDIPDELKIPDFNLREELIEWLEKNNIPYQWTKNVWIKESEDETDE